MTYFAGSLYPFVSRASPVGHPPILRHSSSSSDPAARWIAPSTPPPPSSDSLAALTIASIFNLVMSACMTSIFGTHDHHNIAVAKFVSETHFQCRDLRRLSSFELK